MAVANSVTFATREAVDFAIIGSGSAGGIIAKELLGGGPRISGQTFRSDASKTAESPESQPIRYAQTVGGSSFVTSGRGQPTMTIMALAFRAAHHIKIAASTGEI